MNKKKLLIIMIILGIAFIILGSTFAYLSWRSSEEQKTNVVFTITGDFSCAADGGGNITSNDLILVPTEVTTSTSSNYIKREVKVKPTITKTGKTIYMDLWLDINGIDSGLTNSDNFMYAFTTSSTSPTDGVVASGNFKDKTVGDKIELLSAKNYSITSTDTYYLWIWLDSAETSQTTMDQTFSLSLNGSCTDRVIITAATLINKVNPSTLTYADATDEQKGEMWTFSHNATEQLGATTDYRYIGGRYCSYESGQYGTLVNSNGTCPKRYNYVRTTIGYGTTDNYFNQSYCPSNSSAYTYVCTELRNDGIIGVEPNNYITFNNETWRIIGVIEGKIKIIKDIPIKNLAVSYDYKKSGVGSSTGDFGSNDWTDAQLMYMLNPTSYKLKEGYTLDGNYIKDAKGNIIYQLGCKPAEIASGATSYNCTQNTWSLDAVALSQISETTYYLGGPSSYSGLGADDYYNFERGITVYNNTRPTSWNGLVGLMYPSDYAYTFANGVDDICYTYTHNCNASQGGIPSSSWLYKSNLTYNNQWTISHNSGNEDYVFDVGGGGAVVNLNAYRPYLVRPVVYLKSDTQLSGSGTSTEPYEIIG